MAFGGVKTPPNAIYSQRPPARTRGTLMPTKRTGGNVMLYGRFSWNLGRPETKGFWPPTRQGYALFWQGFAQSDRFDLREWYRFQRPGNYSVTVTSGYVVGGGGSEVG